MNRKVFYVFLVFVMTICCFNVHQRITKAEETNVVSFVASGELDCSRNGTAILMNWEDKFNNEFDFRIFIKGTNNGWIVLENIPADNTSYLFLGLYSGTFRIQAYTYEIPIGDKVIGVSNEFTITENDCDAFISKIIVDSPAKGEVITKGEKYTIKWSTVGSVQDFAISLARQSQDTGENTGANIIYKYIYGSDDKSYVWDTNNPFSYVYNQSFKDLPEGSNYYLLLQGYDKTKTHNYQLIYAKSELFTIKEGSVVQNNDVNNIEENKQEISCNSGYALSLDKSQCIKIPDNAHSVESTIEVWQCNDGFKEVGNSCIVIQKQEEQKIQENENISQNSNQEDILEIQEKKQEIEQIDNLTEQKDNIIKKGVQSFVSFWKNLFTKIANLFK